MSIFQFIFILLLFTPSTIWACGSDGEMTDTQIQNSTLIQTIFTDLQNHYPREGAEGFSIESIIRSGRDSLNLDKEVTASAKCAANYIHVYIESESEPGFLCNVSFEGNADGRVSIDGSELRLACRTAPDAKAKLVVIPFNAY